MLLAGAHHYLDPGDMQVFDTLRLKIETRRRAEQHAQSAALQARKPEDKPWPCRSAASRSVVLAGVR